jgi:hypothetical protein
MRVQHVMQESPAGFLNDIATKVGAYLVHPQNVRFQVSKHLVSKRPVSKRQVYKTSGIQNVRFQNVVSKRPVFKFYIPIKQKV